MKSRLTYEGTELVEKDLVVFYYQEGIDDCLYFTLYDFVPEDYYIGVRYGTEEYDIHDYSPKDWFDETVSHKDLCKLVKEFEDGQ
jgi:hypothetical protein